MTALTWVLESSVFSDRHASLKLAIDRCGDQWIEWNDDWWLDGIPSHLADEHVVFHGALGTAARIESDVDWWPGSFCPTEAFRCSSWYRSVQPWLLHPDWRVLPADELVEWASAVAEELGSPDRLFVRPDSPLKPFSGRVVEVAGLTLDTLDHGFYYDDESLPVVVAPVQEVGAEWRFVVVDGQVVTGSGYEAATRSATTQALDGRTAQVAAEIANGIEAPAEIYVLDLCETAADIRLMELNPFGGADLYACDAEAIVREIGRWARRIVAD